MKKVFSNKQETAHAWASRSQDSGREGSRVQRIFFEGDTIYSYGYHFPIASFYDKKKRGKTIETVVLMTSRKYSNTTSAHIWAVRSAASNYKKIYCNSPTDAARGIHTENLKAFESEAHNVALSLRKAKKPENYLSLIRSARAQATEYAEFFGLSLKSKKFGMKYIFVESKDMGTKATDKEIEEQEKANRKQEKARAQGLAKQIAEFRSGERDYIEGYRSEFTLLRALPGVGVNTSKRVQIPESEAIKAWKRIKEIQGGASPMPYEKIFGFILDPKFAKDHFSVGCHKIQFSELDATAQAMGWTREYSFKEELNEIV